MVVFVVSPVYAVEHPAELSDIVGIIRNLIKLLAPAAAIALFIMLLYGGYQFLTSGGDPKATAQARNTLTYAMLGIILVVGVWLTLALIQAVTGARITVVCWPGFCP